MHYQNLQGDRGLIRPSNCVLRYPGSVDRTNCIVYIVFDTTADMNWKCNIVRTQDRAKLNSLAPNSLLFPCKEGVLRSFYFYSGSLAILILGRFSAYILVFEKMTHFLIFWSGFCQVIEYWSLKVSFLVSFLPWTCLIFVCDWISFSFFFIPFLISYDLSRD